MQSLGVQDIRGNVERHLHPSCSSDVPKYAQGSTNEQPTYHPYFNLLVLNLHQLLHQSAFEFGVLYTINVT